MSRSYHRNEPAYLYRSPNILLDDPIDREYQCALCKHWAPEKTMRDTRMGLICWNCLEEQEEGDE